MSKYISLSLLTIIVSLLSFNVAISQAKQKTKTSTTKNKENKYKVTFIELGSVKCIPCKKMQPVIKSIEEKYSKVVKVIFYDVWTPEGKEASKDLVFNEIPTQIFLDQNGKEFFRHVGFFPEEEIVKMLQQKGIK
jgi:thioredoxin 1